MCNSTVVWSILVVRIPLTSRLDPHIIGYLSSVFRSGEEKLLSQFLQGLNQKLQKAIILLTSLSDGTWNTTRGLPKTPTSHYSMITGPKRDKEVRSMRQMMLFLRCFWFGFTLQNCNSNLCVCWSFDWASITASGQSVDSDLSPTSSRHRIAQFCCSQLSLDLGRSCWRLRDAEASPSRIWPQLQSTTNTEKYIEDTKKICRFVVVEIVADDGGLDNWLNWR
jgi:hypothetical protein